MSWTNTKILIIGLRSLVCATCYLQAVWWQRLFLQQSTNKAPYRGVSKCISYPVDQFVISLPHYMEDFIVEKINTVLVIYDWLSLSCLRILSSVEIYGLIYASLSCMSFEVSLAVKGVTLFWYNHCHFLQHSGRCSLVYSICTAHMFHFPSPLLRKKENLSARVRDFSLTFFCHVRTDWKRLWYFRDEHRAVYTVQDRLLDSFWIKCDFFKNYGFHVTCLG